MRTFAISLSLLLAACASPPRPSAEPSALYSYRLSLKLQVTPSAQDLLRVQVPIPSTGEFQEVGPLLLQGKGTRIHDKLDPQGNRFAEIRPGVGGTELRASLQTTVRRYRIPGHPRVRPSGQTPAHYLLPVQLDKSDERHLGRFVLRLVGGEPNSYLKARILFDALRNDFVLRPFDPEKAPRPLPRVFESRSGSAYELAATYCILLRMAGVPARCVLGYRMRSEVGNPLPTAWVQFYISGVGWLPADIEGARLDPSRASAFFGGLDEYRVRVHILCRPEEVRGPVPMVPRVLVGPKEVLPDWSLDIRKAEPKGPSAKLRIQAQAETQPKSQKPAQSQK
ncbi:MAG TPA: hypothetical protein ENK02_15220 [Planctomycetes bacterium]|nr:hypothetical protein [Planctomycetota bacterium]